MKNKILFLILSLHLSLIGSQPLLQWDVTYAGASSIDKGKDIVVDNNGNSYVTAISYGHGSGSDFLTIKYDKNGDTLWTRRFNGVNNGIDEPSKIVLDYSGAIYVVGKSQSQFNGFDIVTIKYDQAGNVLWKNILNGVSNRDDIPYNMAADNIGNVYVTGLFYTSEVVVKINNLGLMQWNKLAPAQLITINKNDGNIILASGVDYYNPYLIQSLRPSDGKLVQEYNTHSTSYRNGIPNSLILDAVGNIYITSTSTEITSSNPHVVLTQRFDYPGSANEKYGAWFSTSIAGNGTISGVKSLIDENSNIYVLSDLFTGNHHDYHIKKYNIISGKFWKFQYNSGSNIDDIPIEMGLSNKIEPDIYVTGNTNIGNINTIKINSSGIQIGEVIYDCGNGGNDAVAKMTIDGDDNLYLTGSSNCEKTLEDIKTIKYCNTAPSRPDPIIGKTEVCNKVSETYQVDPVNGAIDYSWSLPDKWIILSGDRTNKITVIPGVSGNITVKANSALCSSLPQGINVSVYKIPTVSGKIIGDSLICDNNLHTYSIKPIIDAFEYVWILPNGSMTSQPSNEIDVDHKGVSGILKVFARNFCGTSDTLELMVKVGSPPSKPDAIIGNAKICPSTINNYKVKVIPGATSYIWKKPSDWLFIGDSTSAEVNIACNQSSGEISVAASSICGTSSLEKLQINVLNKPSMPGVISGPAMVCQGTANLYSIKPVQYAEKYHWVFPNGIHGNNSTTNEILTYADSLTGGNILVSAENDCFISDKQPLYVTLTEVDNTITVNGDTLIANENNASYQWIDCSFHQDISGATSQSFKPMVSGNFAVRLSKNNCTEESKCFLVTGQKDIYEIPKILIYPNPTSKLLNISINNEKSEDYNIELYDIYGKLILSRGMNHDYHKSVFQLEMDPFPNGIYLLRINSIDYHYTGRIIKE